MSRKLLLLPLVLIGIALAATCRPKPADPLSSAALPAPSLEPGVLEALAPLWEGAPPPRFAELRFLSTITERKDGTVAPMEIVARMVTAAGWRSVVEQEQGRKGERWTSLVVGPPGLLEAVVTWKSENGGRTNHLRYGLHEVGEVEGALFPLAVGNRLRFTTVEVGEDWLGTPRAGLEKLVSRFEYVYEVTGTTGRWASATPAVPGPVFVVRRRLHGTVDVSDPEAEPETDERELHYSVALGAVVYERRMLDGAVHELRLAAWR